MNNLIKNAGEELKILYIINNLSSGGAEKIVSESIPIINEDDKIDVSVLLLSDQNNVFDKSLKERGIRIDVIPYKKIYSVRNIFYIRKYLINGQFDIVHVHLFPSQYWVSLASKFIFHKRPILIATEHSTNNRRRNSLYFKYIDRLIYSCFDKIISISSETQNNLTTWLNPTNLNKFVLIENGIDVEKFSNIIGYKKNELNKEFNENTKLICMVGRFDEAKDQPTLIRTINKLPENVHLLLIGEGRLRGESEKLAEQLRIKERVHFLGFRDDVNKILKSVDIVVLSSKWEGMSLASIEGMASGRPFVASNVQGLKELPGDNCILFEVGNSDELSIILNDILNNYDAYLKQINNNIKYIEKYSIKNMVNKILEVYNSNLQ